MIIYLVYNLIFSYLLINSVNCSDHRSHHKCNNIFNKPLEKQNPSAHNPPKTDSGGPTFKYSFTLARLNRFPGGWSRSISVIDLPIATKALAIQLRLEKYGVRKLHWHDCAVLGYVIWGKARITSFGGDGQAFVGDVRKGDLFYFPPGWAHSVQGLCDDGVFIFTVDNAGAPATFNLDGWFKHIPLNVLAKNFETPRSTFKDLPKENILIFEGQPHKPLREDLKYVAKNNGLSPQSLIYRKERSRPNITRPYGSVRIIDKRNFPVTTISALIIKLKEGALRELHWNVNSDVLIYVLYGQCRVSTFFGNGLARTQDLEEGDVGYVQQYRGYYVENTGDCELKFIEVLVSANFADVSLGQWLAHTPPCIVNGNLRTGERFIRHINKTEQYIAGCRS